MRKTMLMTALMTALMTTTECLARPDVRAEREDGLYRSAMDDYRAGRIASAIETFEKLTARSPENTSARFQLACLLQDSKRDFGGAFCAYREYLHRCPDGDKASLARDRLAICEKELAKELAAKYGLSDSANLSRELEAVRADLKSAERRLASSEKSARELQVRIQTLTAERDRTIAALKGGDETGAGSAAAGRAQTKEAKDLLEETDEDVVNGEAPGTTLAKEAKTLLAESEDEISAGSLILPKRPANAAAPAEKKKVAAPGGPAHPKTYTVEDGDTLYGVSKRFYGTVSAWKRIRDANKALISADNRLRAGIVLTLP